MTKEEKQLLVEEIKSPKFNNRDVRTKLDDFATRLFDEVKIIEDTELKTAVKSVLDEVVTALQNDDYSNYDQIADQILSILTADSHA